jgi:hypothetical protein
MQIFFLEIKGNLYIWIRIRIQQLKLMRKITYPCGSGSETSIKDVQATGDAFSTKKENIEDFEILNLLAFCNFVGHFCPPGSGSGLRIRIRIQFGSESALGNRSFVCVL